MTGILGETGIGAKEAARLGRAESGGGLRRPCGGRGGGGRGGSRPTLASPGWGIQAPVIFTGANYSGRPGAASSAPTSQGETGHWQAEGRAQPFDYAQGKQAAPLQLRTRAAPARDLGGGGFGGGFEGGKWSAEGGDVIVRCCTNPLRGAASTSIPIGCRNGGGPSPCARVRYRVPRARHHRTANTADFVCGLLLRSRPQSGSS